MDIFLDHSTDSIKSKKIVRPDFTTSYITEGGMGINISEKNCLEFLHTEFSGSGCYLHSLILIVVHD